MKKFLQKNNRIVTILLAFVFALGALGAALYAYSFSAKAAYNTDKAITFEEFNQRTPVGEKYFFVGTYLFPLDVISDEIFEKALESQKDMNQYNEYYKSELAGGVWYDLSDATDLTSITNNGTTVEDSKINKLWVTVYIDKDGKTHDAKTMASVSLFDTPDPYDLKEIPELNTLYTQYRSIFSEASQGVDLYYYEQLKSFFDTDIRDIFVSIRGQTDELDQKLKNLQIIYDTIQEKGKTEEAEEVMKLMKRVDNARRALVYQKLAVGTKDNPEYELNKLLMLLSNTSEGGETDINNPDEIEQSTMPYDVWTNSRQQYTYDQLYEYVLNHDGLVEIENEDDEENNSLVMPDIKSYFGNTSFSNARANKEVFKQNDSIISAIYEADSNCKTAYDKYTSESLASPDSHIGQLTNTIEETIFLYAQMGYSPELEELIERYVYVSNISSNVVKDKDQELSLITENLLSDCENGFKALVSGGAGEVYSAALAQGANSDGLKNALEDQDAKLKKEMTELEFVISAYRMRVTPKECFTKAMKWIDWTEALKSEVADDVFSSKAKLAVNSHKTWLTNLLDELAKEDQSLQSELDKLKAQKESLLEEKMKALDDNDLNGSKKIDAKIAELDKKIDEEISKSDAAANDSDSSAGERAASALGLNGTTQGAIQDIKNDALNKLSNGEDISDELSALSLLGAKDALSEVNNASKEASNSGNNGTGNNGAGDDGTGNNGAGDDGTGNNSAGNDGAGNDGQSSDSDANKNADDNDKKDDDKKDDDKKDDDKKDDKKDSNDDKDKNNTSDNSNSNNNGKFSVASLSEQDFRNLIKDILGDDFENLDPASKVIASIALEWIGDEGNVTAKLLSKNFIEICANEKNIYVYDSYLNGAIVMVNLQTLGKVTDYRYVYKGVGKEGVLAKGTESYRFKASSDTMIIEPAKSKNDMVCIAIYKNGNLYIPVDTVKEFFDYSAENVKYSSYSAVLSSKMESKAKELLEAFRKGGM